MTFHYRVLPLTGAIKVPKSCTFVPTKSHTMKTAHRDILDRLTRSASEVYDPAEARAVALVAAEHLTGRDRVQLLADPRAEADIDPDRLRRFAAEIAAARPVQYLTGHTEFCGLDIRVGEGVLVPRPETEELVRWIAGGTAAGAAVIDIGTGSGAIAVALASMIPDASVAAIDISPAAIEYARANAAANGCRIETIEADATGEWWRRFEAGGTDVVVSNPPYVPLSDRARMHRNVTDYEPSIALFVPDDDPLLFYRPIADGAARVLRSGGELYFEIYERAAEQLCRMLSERGWSQIELRRDINDKNRMIRCRKS